MKREVDYEKAWKKLRRWIKDADLESDWSPTDSVSIKMDEIRKQCTKKREDE